MLLALFFPQGHPLRLGASPYSGCDRLPGHVQGEISTGGEGKRLGGGWGEVMKRAFPFFRVTAESS